MRKKIILIYFLIFVFALLLGGYFFLCNIYGSEVNRLPQNLFADTSSEMIIEVIPINAFGKKALFRSSSATFEIVEGIDLIEIIEYKKEIGFLKIRSKGKAGLVGIKIKSQHSLLPEYIEIEILALTVEYQSNKNNFNNKSGMKNFPRHFYRLIFLHYGNSCI